MRPPTSRPPSPRGRLALSSLPAGLVVTALAVSALTATPAAATGATGDDFSVAELPDGGYRVTLELDEPLPVRDAVPELAVDGQVLGWAQESPDGLSLTLDTADVSVLDAADVDVAWNGLVPGTEVASRRAATQAPQVLTAESAEVLTADPATPGPYGVERLDYDLGDTATTLSGLGAGTLPVELRAAVYAPVGARGPRPVVVFLHGRHSACYNPVTRQSNNTNWPCATGFLPIDSHLGYTETAEALTTHGYVVVSVSANGINAKDAGNTDDNGGLARGELVMQHLDLLEGWSQVRGTPGGRHPLAGRLDLRNVGLMGHSRGGEGVVEAALLNADRSAPYGIRAVLPLAPVDFGRPTLPDVPMAVLLPYCDGDVSNQQGQHFYDDTRYATDDDVLRSSVMLMGTNHNFFNTEWTPGATIFPANDDWSASTDEVCGGAVPSTRLSAAEQRAVGTAWMAGFFRMVQGGETQFLPLFDGSNATVPSVGDAAAFAQAQQAGSRRVDVAPLERPEPGVSVTGFDLGAYCYSIASRVAAGDVPCSSTSSTSKVPHWTPATFATSVPTSPVLRLQWSEASTDPVVTAALDAGERNVRRYDALTFRVARDEAAVGDVDLDVTVTDGRGRSATVSVADLGPALDPFPASTNTNNGRNLLGKTWLRTVRVPTASLRGVTLTDVRSVSVRPATPTGGVYLSDIAFDTPTVGRGGPTDLAQLSIVDTTVTEGDGPGTATMAVTFDEPLLTDATVNVQTAASGSSNAGQVPLGASVLTIPAGATSAQVQVPLVGNTTDNTDSLRYKVTLSSPVGAVVGDGFGWLTVLDDDLPPA